jgi:hypothetical protein
VDADTVLWQRSVVIELLCNMILCVGVAINDVISYLVSFLERSNVHTTPIFSRTKFFFYVGLPWVAKFHGGVMFRKYSPNFFVSGDWEKKFCCFVSG